MKTFKVTKTKTQTFKPTNIKSLTEFNGAIAAGVNGKVLTKLPVESIEAKPQVRTVIENIDELAESMKSGQLIPITVIKGEIINTLSCRANAAGLPLRKPAWRR